MLNITSIILRRSDFTSEQFFNEMLDMLGVEQTPNRETDEDDEVTVYVAKTEYEEAPDYEPDFEPDVDEAQEWADFDPDC